MRPTILFWDIDGTLIDTGGAGMEAWRRSLEEMCGAPTGLPDLPTAGLTDVLIARVLANAAGLPAAGGQTTDRLLARYLELLPDTLREAKGRVLPNVRDTLRLIDSRADVHSLLLTGNVAVGGCIKLEHFGLFEHFEGGAFADGTADRVQVAHRAAAAAKECFGGDCLRSAFVLGDTPADIDCGHAIGVRTIGVATGPHTIDALATRSPWRVLGQLPSACDMLSLISEEDAFEDPGK